MKSILFATQHFQLGGVEKSLLELIKSLDPSEYDVTVVYMHRQGQMYDEISRHCRVLPMGIPPLSKAELLEYAKKGKLWKVAKGVVGKIRASLTKNKVEGLRRIVRMTPALKKKYDYAVAFHAPNSLPVLYTLENVTAGKKYCWIHFNMATSAATEYDAAWGQVYRTFDQLVCVSKTAADALLQRYPDLKDRVSVIYNLVNHEEIHTLAKENMDIIRKPEETILCTVGRLSADKGYMLVLDVCRMLDEAGYDFRWLIVGEGHYRQEIERKRTELGMENRFIMTGGQKNPYRYINGADIYVQPSRTEGYCTTMMEARVLKKPIVAANFVNAYEQIEDDISGRIVDYQADALFEAIRELIDNPQKCARLANNVVVPDNEEVCLKIDGLFHS